MRTSTLAAALLGTGVGAVALATLWPGERETVTASSHREAPLIYNDPAADNTDIYAFRSPDAPSTVTLIADFIPLQDPAAGPYFYNFGSDVAYDIHVDNNGDAMPDITYRFRFSRPTAAVSPATGKTSSLYNTGAIGDLNDADWLYKQTYTLSRIQGGTETVLGTNLKVPPANIGPKSTANYDALANAAIATVGGIKAFAGPRDDPFFIDTGGIFDLLTIRPGAPGDMGGGIDGLSNYNVSTLALQIPISQLTNDGSVPTDPNDSLHAVLGIWSTASRRSTRVLTAGDTTSSGAMVQVSRLGHGLVNEVVFPTDLKDAFNALKPQNDFATLSSLNRLDIVTDPEFAKLLKALYGLNVPAAGRTDIVDIFLKGIRVPGMNLRPAGVAPAEMLRMNVAVAPKSMGDAGYSPMGVIGGDVSGYPNGRRLTDDLVDISMRVMAGATPLTPSFNVAPNNRLGDGVDQNDKPFMTTFPYVATPHQGFTRGTMSQRVEPANAQGPRISRQ